MSTLSPSTPSSLTVPPSQNTAPVIKFRCLYTYDLRRKAKRWQDGFLRFHTFNKRVMVYDTPGNFIGDLHWRQGADVQDGDEFELDKGVIVEVCECIETTETDLSKLFESKKPAHASPKPTQCAAQSPRLSSAQQSPLASQPLRPQPSLNDLLGIRRTPIGRLVSPYEERHSMAQRDQQNGSGRAAKRQRVHQEERRQETRRQVPNCPPPVIDLSESSTRLPETTSTRQPSQSLPRSERGPASEVSNTTRPNPEPKRQSGQIETRPSSSNDGPSVSHVHKNPQPEAPANTLRLSTEKRRKKMMYQALLSTQGAARPLEPVQSGKRSNPIVMPGSQSQSVENVAPSQPLVGAEFMPSASTQLALDMVDVEPANGRSTKQDTRSRCSGQTPVPQVLEPPDTSTSSRSLDPNGPPITQPAPSKIAPPTLDQSAPSGPISRRMSPQKGLRKSLSDPTALTTAAGIQSTSLPGKCALPTLDEDKVDDQGPWSSEALDLFDFWPPGRPKPS